MIANSKVSPASHDALRAALQRLAQGTPTRSDGTFTVTTLAAEAGVSRSTANRAPDVLRDLEQLRQRAGDLPSAGNGDTDISELRKELADTKRANNKAVKELEGSIDILAQHVQVLTLDNERLRKAVEAKGSTVAPLRGRDPGPTLVE
jgi:type I site-specific restriction endonuclease